METLTIKQVVDGDPFLHPNLLWLEKNRGLPLKEVLDWEAITWGDGVVPGGCSYVAAVSFNNEIGWIAAEGQAEPVFYNSLAELDADGWSHVPDDIRERLSQCTVFGE